MGNPIVSVIQLMTNDEKDREYMTERIYELSASAFIFSFIFGSFGLIIFLNKRIHHITPFGTFSFFLFVVIFSAIVSYLTLSTLTARNKKKVLFSREIKQRLQSEIDRANALNREIQRQEREQREQEARIRQQAEQQRKTEEAERQRQERKEAEELEQKRRKAEQEKYERGLQNGYFSILEDNFYASQVDYPPSKKMATTQPVNDQTEETETDEAERLRDIIRKRTE